MFYKISSDSTFDDHVKSVTPMIVSEKSKIESLGQHLQILRNNN